MNNFDLYSDKASDREMLDEVFPLRKIIIFAFLLAVSCVYLPCAILSIGYQQTPVQFIIPAYIIIGGGIVLLFTVIKRLIYSISCAIILFFLYSYTASPILPAIAAAIVLIFTIGGFLSSICAKKLYPLLALFPIVSYIGAFGMTGDWLISLLAVIPLLAAITQGILQRKNAERKTIILISTVVFVSLLAGVAALFLHLTGRLSFAAIKSDISFFRDTLASQLKSMYVGLDGEAVELLDPDYIDALVLHTFNMLPALITVVTFAVIYFSHSLQLTMYQNTDYDLLITPKTTKINMSIYAASAFVLSYILSLTTDVAGRPSMLGVVSGNLCIILLPGLFLVGIDSFSLIVRKLRGLGFIIIILLLVAFIALSSYALYIVAAIGAFYIIITSIDKWAKKHYSGKQS